MLSDLRYAIRTFLKTPGLSAVAILTVALGAGANTVLFSAVNSVLLKPLRFPAADRLTLIWGRNFKEGRDRQPLSLETYRQLTAMRGSEAIGAVSPSWAFTARTAQGPEQFQGYWATASFLRVLGVEPRQGRLFTDADDRADAAPVVLVSARLWERAFGAATRLDGQTMMISNTIVSVVGVLPEHLRFLDEADVWMPLAPNPFLARPNATAGGFLTILARRRADISPAALDAEARTIADQLAAASPANYANISAYSVALQDEVVGGVRRGLLVLSGAVGCVLLIACANIANLLLTRAIGRRREMAIRVAVGAGRGRLWRQLLVEGLTLAGAGTALGVAAAWWSIRFLRSVDPTILPRASEIALDPTVLIFAAGICVLAGAGFALAPALTARGDLAGSLKDGGRTTVSATGVRTTLVVAEIALSLMLLVGAGLLTRSFVRLTGVDPGFVPDHLLTLQIGVPPKYGTDAGMRQALYDDVFARLEAIPGIRAAGGSTRIPMRNGVTTTLSIEGRRFARGEEPEVEFRRVSPHYFTAMGIPVAQGRAFDARDSAVAPRVAIVNRALADRYFATEDPIGRRIRFFPGDQAWWTIVGIVGDVRQFGLDTGPRPEVYMHFAQGPPSTPLLAIRTAGDPASVVSAVRQTLQQAEPDLVIWNVETMQRLVSNSVARRRLNMLILAGFAALAMVLAAIGIYGVLAYFVTERRQELGVRLALGATAQEIVRLVVGRGMTMAALGVVLGLAGALALSRVLTSLLFEVSPFDPLTFGLVSTALTTVALAACLIPARRAMRVDPLVALRSE